MPMQTRPLTCITHTNGGSSQSGGTLIPCLPVIHLSSSPLIDPLFPSLAQLSKNIFLSLYLCLPLLSIDGKLGSLTWNLEFICILSCFSLAVGVEQFAE